MKSSVILPLILALCLAYASAQFPNNKRQTNPVSTTVTEEPENQVATTISTYIVDFLTRKIQFFFELLDIKVRSIRFLTSLYTTDNLVLLKKVMNVGLRVGNWLYTVIPNSTTEGHSVLLSLLFPQINQGENYQDFSSEDPEEGFSKDEPPETSVSSTTEATSAEEEYANSLSEQIHGLNNLINGNRYYYN